MTLRYMEMLKLFIMIAIEIIAFLNSNEHDKKKVEQKAHIHMLTYPSGLSVPQRDSNRGSRAT